MKSLFVFIGRVLLYYSRNKQHKKIIQFGLKNIAINFEGLKFNYYYSNYSPDKKNLVLIHGFLDSSLTFRNVIKDLLPHYNLYLVDTPGFGKSTLPNIRELWQLDLMSRAMGRMLLHHLHLKNFSVLTHSMGGIVALHIWEYLRIHAKKNPIEKIHMIAPGVLEMDKGYQSRIRKMFYPENTKEIEVLINSLTFKKNKKLPNIILQALLCEWSKPGYEYLALNTLEREKEIFFSSKELQKIKCRVYLYWGKKDEIVSVHKGRLIHKNLPDSEMFFFSDCGHVVHLEQTEAFTKSFLENQ